MRNQRVRSLSQTILIVEDEPIVRAMCQTVLDRNGFRSLLAENGQEGLTLFLAQHPEIALVLSDISMPVMNGIDMVKEIFKFQPHSNIILMTGLTPEPLVPEYLQKLCAVIYKPFRAQELLAAIRKCLGYEETHPTS